MRELTGLSYTLMALALVVPAQASAQSVDSQRIAIKPKALKAALQEVARRFRVELLFSDDVIGTGPSPAISGRYTVREAFSALLAGSGLTIKGSPETGFVVVFGPELDRIASPPMPEIMVIGQRTQNADIRRRSNDVQPYQLLTLRDIRSTHQETVSELLSKRVSQNALASSFAQQPISGAGSVSSAINLRGLGLEDTLVLVDGRPMPRVPYRRFMFGQPDVNALSVESIERAEILTSTAGGIYGPGAVAGVVNLVLRRDYRGADVAVTGGLTARGDAAYQRLDMRFGFTPDQGATNVMVAYSRSVSDGLDLGSRDFIERARTLRSASGLPYRSFTELPVSRSVNIMSNDRTPLVLKAAYGGSSLGSTVTNLQPQDERSLSGMGAALLARAGSLDLSLPEGRGGLDGSLLAAQRTNMLLANVRHQFGPGLEAYVDLIHLRDEGRVKYSPIAVYQGLEENDPRNPFTQPIGLVMSTPAYGRTGGTRADTTRISAGAIFDLPANWKGNLDYSLGSARQRQSFIGTTHGLDILYALYGVPLAGRPAIDFFTDPRALKAVWADYAVPTSVLSSQINSMSDVAGRFAGPLGHLSDRPIVATVLLEQRKEKVAQGQYEERTLFGLPYDAPFPSFSERVRSAYLELRVPVFANATAVLPLRDLELQLAMRHDATRVGLKQGYLRETINAADAFDHAGRAATTYTLGAKTRPIPGLLLRASIATGERTPSLADLANTSLIGEDGPDPKRGGSRIDKPYDLLIFNSGRITPERARSVSAGLVATPLGSEDLFLSLDYTNIHLRHEINGLYLGNVFYFLMNEDIYPDRVTRLALTPEDAARGYSGGVITRIDTSLVNTGWTRIGTVDTRFSYRLKSQDAGDFTFRANLSWQPRFSRRIDATERARDYVDYADGVLQWRGNGGIDWSSGKTDLAVTGQVFGSYRFALAADAAATRSALAALQKRSRVPAQITFDVAAAHRLDLSDYGPRLHSLTVRMSVQNIFDKRPPTVAAAEGGYSYYADPRGRRFEMTLAMGI